MPVNVNSLKTTWLNPTAQTRFYPFIGPHGVSLAAGHTVSTHGGPYDFIRKVDAGRRAGLDAALLAGLVAIVSSDQPVYADAESGAAAVLSVNAGDVVATAPPWGGTSPAVPYIVSATPAGGSKSVPVNSAFAFTFSAPVTGTTVVVATGGTAVAGTLVASAGNTVYTFTPTSNLTGSTAYQIEVAGAVDGSSNLMVPETFAVGTAPTFTIVPAAAATGVSVNTTVAVTFGSAVSGATVTLAHGSTANPGTTVISGANRVYTLTPTVALAASTLYTVTISGGADTFGNKVATATSTFTTA